ncbi:MAG: hypothetical protein KDB61_08535, partial [Planctomycetes bacterium]|nr:hypothetical protein [Planctomycetota bacterium]
GESDHVAKWLELGVRDRRPAQYKAAVEDLLASRVLDNLEDSYTEELHARAPELIERYASAFQSSAALIPQDSGCCNVRLTDQGPLFYDWADVVIGHSTFSCDRLLDQAPREDHDAIIEAFLEPLHIPRPEFNAMRRSNVLHEVLRYHDELQHIPESNQVHQNLANSVRSQLRVLLDHERKHSSS